METAASEGSGDQPDTWSSCSKEIRTELPRGHGPEGSGQVPENPPEPEKQPTPGCAREPAGAGLGLPPERLYPRPGHDTKRQKIPLRQSPNAESGPPLSIGTPCGGGSIGGSNPPVWPVFGRSPGFSRALPGIPVRGGPSGQEDHNPPHSDSDVL